MGEVNGLVTQTALAIRDEDELEAAASILDAALRRAKAEGQLVLTEDLPEKPGKYWWKLHPDSEPEIMSVLAYADGSAMPHCDYGQWAGPIVPPLDARAAQIEEGE